MLFDMLITVISRRRSSRLLRLRRVLRHGALHVPGEPRRALIIILDSGKNIDAGIGVGQDLLGDKTVASLIPASYASRYAPIRSSGSAPMSPSFVTLSPQNQRSSLSAAPERKQTKDCAWLSAQRGQPSVRLPFSSFLLRFRAPDRRTKQKR